MATLLFRTDAGPLMGTGHAWRCLALAQAWQRKHGVAILAVCELPEALDAVLAHEGIEVVRLKHGGGTVRDAEATAEVARARGAQWVAVDGYHFDASYQASLKEAGLRLLFVDDYGHAKRYSADLVLNHNVYANESFYAERDPGTRLLLGCRYGVLRQEFLAWADRRRDREGSVERVLVTLGGADPDNVSRHVLSALAHFAHGSLEARVIVGPANPHREELEASLSGIGIACEVNSFVRDMPAQMDWADLAITGGGTTCMELAYMGVPMVLVILADNQVAVAEGLAAEGAALNAGWGHTLAPDQLAAILEGVSESPMIRARLARRGRDLVDGRGADRVVNEILSASLSFRPAEATDARLFWEWANEPEVRRQSFSSEPIPWEAHLSWYEKQLQAPGAAIYVAMNQDDAPVGQARFEPDDGGAVISVSVDAAFRNCGYGTCIIRNASRRYLAETGRSLVHAFIRQENAPSVRAFEQAGYRQVEATQIRGAAAHHLIFTAGANGD